MKSISMLVAVAVLCAVAFAQEVVKIEISVSKEGIVALAGQPTTLDELVKRLALIPQKENRPAVEITAAAEAPLKVTTAVLDACRKNGLNKIRIRSR